MDYTVLAEALKKEIEARKDLETVLEAVQGAQGAEQVVREAQERTAAAQKAYQQAADGLAQVTEAAEQLKAQYAEDEKIYAAKRATLESWYAKAATDLDAQYRAKDDELADLLSRTKAGYESAVAGYKAELADYETRTKAAEAALAALKGA